MIPVIDMFSSTGELARAVADGLNEFTCFQSFSDNYGPARKYLKTRFRNVKIHSDFRDQDVPEGSIVTLGAPCQDLSVAGRHAGAERGSGTRSSLIHEALDMAVTDGFGGTYIEYRDRYGLPASFRRRPFDQVLKVVDQGGLF